MAHGIMSAVLRRIAAPCLPVLLALLAAGCSLDPDKQWYKPGGTYTMADFERDRVACTRNRVLDEECLKQRGWVALSPDRSPPAPTPPPDRKRF